jgi:hypothetical protein
MSDLDERLARWKAQTATLQTPPELKERLKQTTSSSAAARGALSGMVKAGGLVVLAVVVAVGLRFWPRHADVEKPVAPSPVSVSVEQAPPSAVGADPVSAGAPIAAVPGSTPVAVVHSQAIAPPAPALAQPPVPARDAGPRPLP